MSIFLGRLEKRVGNSRIWTPLMPSNFKASLNNPFPVLKKDNIRFVPAKNWNGVVEVPVVCFNVP